MSRVCKTLLCLGLCAGAAEAAAWPPPGAGIARAVAGQWTAALDRIAAVPASERGRADRYFHAVSRLELGLRGPALEGLRELSESDGPFAGPALELGVKTLFEDGRFAAVVAWAEESLATRIQDADAFHYRVGQSHLLLGRPALAEGSLEKVVGGEFLPYALHSRALLEVGARRFGPAVDLLEQAIAAAQGLRDPALADALANTLRVSRGRVLYQLAANAGDLSERDRTRLAELAQKQFNKVPEGSALYPDALRGIGWCALETGDSSRSLASFAAAGGMDPAGRAEDLWAQGRVYERLEFFDEAARLYREAGESALELAEAAPPPVTSQLPAATRWERRESAAGVLATGTEAFQGRLARLLSAADARDRRLEEAKRQVAGRRQRAAELREELASLGDRLHEFLDQITAAALFPPGERGRVRSVGDLQQRLDGDVTRIENALAAIGTTVFWTEASEEQRSRGKALWARLERAKESLAGLQLGFLMALKERVSQRELELATLIRQLQQGALDLDEPLAAADQAHLAAVSLSKTYRGRLGVLSRRVGALGEPLDGLRRTARDQVTEAETRAREERAAQLRLAADQYALDEAQALHRLQERPR